MNKISAAALALGLSLFPAAAQDPRLTLLGTYRDGAYNASAAEIAAHDPATQRLFIVNGAARAIDVLDMSDPRNLRRITQTVLPVTAGYSPNSVAAKNGIIAVASEAQNRQEPGAVAFLDTSGRILSTVTVGAVPDMCTFTPDGRYLLVANEGEPSDDYSADPEGSVSVIDLSRGASSVSQNDVRTAHFRGFTRANLPAGVRIFGPNNPTVAQDLEPEYIAISPDSRTAYVTLQENNAIAVVDIPSASVTRILPLGLKEHWREGNEIDASDRDGGFFPRTWTVWGMYQPDAIAGYVAPNGNFYLVTANEGDAREWGTFIEPERVANLRLDPIRYPNAAEIQQASELGRLNASRYAGDLDGDGDIDMVHIFGARSFTVWSPSGENLFDSHNQFEVFTWENRPAHFNSNHTDHAPDTRSDDKGPEPEALAIGTVRGRPYAFIGNERTSNIMVYDLSAPHSPRYAGMAWNRNVNSPNNTAAAGDLGPEGILFIPAVESPTRQPLLVVANEVSGTTSVWQID